MGKASRRKREEIAAAPAAEDVRTPPGPPPPVDPPEWITRPLLTVLAAAALFRVLYFLSYRAGSVFFDTPFLDAWIYDDWARRIAAGEWSPPDPFYFAPGYPYALALFYKVVSNSVAAVYVAQFVLGLLNITLIHRLTWEAFGRRAATAAAVLAALYASFPFLEAKIMSPTLALTLLLLALVTLLAASARGGVWRWAAGGLLLGATSLVRPETLIAAPFLLAWIVLQGPGNRGQEIGTRIRSAAPAAAALAAGWAIAIAPAAIHNVRAGGGSTLISSQGGITFYQSNNPRARGLYVFLSREGFSGAPEKQAREERDLAEKALGRPLTRSEVSSYWFGKGTDFVLSQPGRFVWLLGMKLLRFVGSYEYSTEYIIYVERETVRLLWLPFVPFALIIALAIPSVARGLAAARARGARAAGRPSGSLNAAGRLLLLTLAANLLTVLTFYVSSRYRLPSVPPLIAFAGATIAGMAGAWRSGRRAEAGATLAVVGVVFLLAHFEKDASATIQEANVHFNTGNLWLGKKDPGSALAEFRRAIQMDDSRYDFFYNMGNSLRDLKRYGEAAEAYGESARRRPQFANAHLRRGQMLLETGDWAGAREPLLKAESLRPEDFDAQLALGRAEARLGNVEEAKRRLDRALRLRPESAAARAERDRLP